jgi:glyoxylate reductase
MTPVTAKMSVVSAIPLSGAHLEQLDDCDVTVVDFARGIRADLETELAEAEGLLVNSHAPVDAGMIEAAKRLRVISTVSVGFDHIPVQEATARGVAVTHTPVLTDAVADLTLGLTVMVARKLKVATDDLGRGVWSTGLLGSDLRGKTLLLVGFGRIGQEVARRALAFKMRVCAFDARAELIEMPGVTRVAKLSDGLADADFVSLHVDLNPSTHHLIDATAIARMKPTAIVINTSRGGVVDQAALTSALLEGRLGGAGLDVLEVEPPDHSDPLLTMDNVVILPHIGSATIETRNAMLDCAIENLVACLRGEHCDNVVHF